jgi:type II secretory ATPase GspE/PulE/Tfp pilus assembly ATPase PilB-like protein
LGIVAQRLARSLCIACKEWYPAEESEYDKLAGLYGAEAFAARFGPWTRDFSLWKSKGCERCAQSGYKGRVALHELLVVDETIRELVQHKGSIQDLRRAAAAGGMTTLLQDGIEKVVGGKTDLRQVQAVCSR